MGLLRLDWGLMREEIPVKLLAVLLSLGVERKGGGRWALDLAPVLHAIEGVVDLIIIRLSQVAEACGVVPRCFRPAPVHLLGH